MYRICCYDRNGVLTPVSSVNNFDKCFVVHDHETNCVFIFEVTENEKS